MTILGIGTDIVEHARIHSLLVKYNDKFVQRILSEQEQVIYSQAKYPGSFLAKRFAAKEAVAKALGTGIGKELAFKEISVTNLANGQPVVTLQGKAHLCIASKGITQILISMSDEKDYSIAFAVITGST